MNARDTVLVPIHPAGYIFIFIFAAIALVLGYFSQFAGFAGFIATAWCVYFFRNPDRMTPSREGLIVATGDGMVSEIVENVFAPKELEMGEEESYTRVSIFLNVFNVHVQRTPIAGSIAKVHYHPGKFLNASLDKASEENERCTAVVETNDGKRVIFVQIAGLVARRIICDLKEGQHVVTGERYGLIRFGSRCDIYLPKGVAPLVAIGQSTVGGETIIADFASKEAAREAVTH